MSLFGWTLYQFDQILISKTQLNTEFWKLYLNLFGHHETGLPLIGIEKIPQHFPDQRPVFIDNPRQILLTFRQHLESSLTWYTIPWPWKKSDFSLTVATLENSTIARGTSSSFQHWWLKKYQLIQWWNQIFNILSTQIYQSPLLCCCQKKP